MAMPAVNETKSWSLSFSREAPATACGASQSSWSYQHQAGKGRCSMLLIFFSIWIEFGNTIMALLCLHHNLYIYIKEHLEMTLSASTYIDMRALFNFQTRICGIWVSLSLSSIYPLLEIMNTQINTKMYNNLTRNAEMTQRKWQDPHESDKGWQIAQCVSGHICRHWGPSLQVLCAPGHLLIGGVESQYVLPWPGRCITAQWQGLQIVVILDGWMAGWVDSRHIDTDI